MNLKLKRRSRKFCLRQNMNEGVIMKEETERRRGMNKKMVAAAVFVVLALGVLFIEDVSSVQRASIGGEVTWVIAPGTRVEEGSALMRVAALSGGEAVAARSGVRGVVRETTVSVGDQVKKGASVAKIKKE